MRLKDKVIIVTGSAQGLGRAYCLELAREGAKIVAVDMRDPTATVSEINNNQGHAIGATANVADPEEVREMVRKAIEVFGRIDVLINNAAVFYGLGLKSFTEIPVEEWDRVMEVNVKGAWLCSKEVAPYMKEQKKGKIINISSSTVWSGAFGLAHYICSKAAVIGLTRAMARELGEYNICVNAIAPGLIMTEASNVIFPEERVRQAVARRSIKRLLYPTDVVGIVIFLASDESDAITGQTVIVDAGASYH